MFFKMLKFSILLFLLLSSRNAFAGYSTGQDLLIACTGAKEDTAEATISPVHCAGYIDGIIDAHTVISSLFPETKMFCLPMDGISTGEAIDVVILYIQNDYEVRSIQGRTVVLKALNKKYPCK